LLHALLPTQQACFTVDIVAGYPRRRTRQATLSKAWILGRARRTEPNALDIDDLQIITAVSENVKLLLLCDFLATPGSFSRASAVSAGPSNT
jgi:hypothetical protein